MTAEFKPLDKDNRITTPEWQAKFLADCDRGMLVEVPYFISYAGWCKPSQSTLELGARRYKALMDMGAEYIAYSDDVHPFFDGMKNTVPFLKRQFLLCGHPTAAQFICEHAHELFEIHYRKNCDYAFSVTTQCFRLKDESLFFMFRCEKDSDEVWGKFENKSKLKVQYYKPSDFGYFYSLKLTPDRKEADTATLI